ncbi:MAG: tetratricopeptide repeat protein [Blastocatellia bacterium]
MRRRPSFPFNFCLRIFFLSIALIGLNQIGAAQQTANPNNPTTGRSAPASHSIRGKIFMPSGKLPELRIRVVLEISAGGIASEAFSDSVGNFEFRGLASGNYRIVIPGDGHTYDTAQENIEAFGAFSRTFVAQIYLKEKSSGALIAKDKILSPADIQEIPKDAKKAFDQGVKLARDDKPEKAGEKFEEALKIFPDYLHALNKLGEQMTRLNKADVAQASFERAISINARFAQPHIGLGMLFLKQQRYDEAIAALETGNRWDDSYPMAHLNLGIALMSKPSPELDRAEKELIRSVEQGKKDFLYVRKLIFNLHVRRQKYDKAAAQLEAYLKESPDAADSQDVRLMLDKVKKAMAQQAAAQKPQ